MSSISRRTALSTIVSTAIGASATALPALALAADRSDAKLFALERELLAAWERLEQASMFSHELNDRYQAQKPPEPQRPPMPDDIAEMYDGITVGELALLSKVQPDHPIPAWQRTVGDAFSGQWRDYQSRIKKLSNEIGLKAAEKAYDDQVSVTYRIGDRLMQTPARTMAGIEAKIRTYDLLDMKNDPDACEMAFAALVEDIRAVAAVAAS